MEQEIKNVMKTFSAIFHNAVLPKQQALAAEADAPKKLNNIVVTNASPSVPIKSCCQ